jgi:bifunctional non-homologous end joining protein LigD
MWPVRFAAGIGPFPRQAEHRPEFEALRANEAAMPVRIPTDRDEVTLKVGGSSVRLTNLRKKYWPNISKGRLLQYYADVSAYLLPHLKGRAMVMKRYPNGIAGDFFFMKRCPPEKPAWVKTCAIEHGSGSIIDFPMIDGLAQLLWVVNLGCIDLNPWYARCDDYNRPDYLHFDLDPVPGATFAQVLETALVVRKALAALGMPSIPKTTGSRGIHVYVPIKRGPLQKQVWTVAKRISFEVAGRNPTLITAEYRKAKRPDGRVLMDYNQNAWGRTLSSVYSVRPVAEASVSMPLQWREVERGVKIDDFRMDNAAARLAKTGDLWKPMAAARGRFDLATLL